MVLYFKKLFTVIKKNHSKVEKDRKTLLLYIKKRIPKSLKMKWHHNELLYTLWSDIVEIEHNSSKKKKSALPSDRKKKKAEQESKWWYERMRRTGRLGPTSVWITVYWFRGFIIWRLKKKMMKAISALTKCHNIDIIH